MKPEAPTVKPRIALIPAPSKLRSISTIRAADIARLHTDLQDTPYNANRVLGLLRAMLNCAERWEMIPRGTNPVAPIKPFPEKKRERYLSHEELDSASYCELG